MPQWPAPPWPWGVALFGDQAPHPFYTTGNTENAAGPLGGAPRCGAAAVAPQENSHIRFPGSASLPSFRGPETKKGHPADVDRLEWP